VVTAYRAWPLGLSQATSSDINNKIPIHRGKNIKPPAAATAASG
jgi:hypothetical protein